MDAATLFVRESVGADDVVLVMGAGPVTEVATKLTK
jgi:UDP-N-acetylmuramate-alanine ligase